MAINIFIGLSGATRKVLTRKVLNLIIRLTVVLPASRRRKSIENIAPDNVVRLGYV